MDDEYVYCRIKRDNAPHGSVGYWATGWMPESMYNEHYLGMNDVAAIVGIKGNYLAPVLQSKKPTLLRNWFVVKKSDDISYEDIAKAVKYG